mmetsp:Transcript_16643/g.21595  ORF Transcript_16643/g.21595 Transcript_16643/m.21595 type:complete len:409 (-) Transcript_16643:329-1555(-)
MWRLFSSLSLFFLLLIQNVYHCKCFQNPNRGFQKTRGTLDQHVQRKVSSINPEESRPMTLDEYKESTRERRRTVFGHDNWRKHRESKRHYRNMKNIFVSDIIGTIRNEVLAVGAVATAIYIYNDVICSGALDQFVGFNLVDDKIKLQSLPFTIGTTALGLLLVFRTTQGYTRWKDARITWGGVINRSFDLVRGGLTYFGALDGYKNTPEIIELKKELTMRTIVFARCLKSHFRDNPDNESILKKELTELLNENEAERIMEAKHRPLRAVQDLSDCLRRGRMTDLQLNIVDKSVAFYCDAIGVSERIFKTPIPLAYTRHTSRSLTIWLLGLPFCLYNDLGTPWEQILTIPESMAIAVFFYGIEEIGVQIEEPFSILPMEAMGDAIERNCKEMLYNHLKKTGVELPESEW